MCVCEVPRQVSSHHDVATMIEDLQQSTHKKEAAAKCRSEALTSPESASLHLVGTEISLRSSTLVASGPSSQTLCGENNLAAVNAASVRLNSSQNLLVK